MKKTIFTIIFTVCFGSAVSAQTSWLDRPITTNWNNGSGVVPTAPRETASSPNSTMCRETIRVADSLADRAVTRAGWFLFGPSYNYGTITIVTAMASVDGMCRPNQYNGFVFVSNRFAGTLSPTPTDARSDGALGDINFFNPDNLTVEFARYTDDDALCCPSRTSTVTYTITTGTRGLLKGEDVDTVVGCPQGGGGGPIQTQDNVVSGTVTYLQRRALPETAVLTVSLLDVSRADAPSIPIAQQRIETVGKQVPFTFDMAYDRTKIQERNRYAVRAEIRDGERLLFTTETNYPVITQGNPRSVEITVVPVGGAGRPNRGESIRGTVTYRQRIALGPKSEVTVKLVDSATPDGTPVAETTFNTDGKQVPLAFELNYEQRDINRQRTYELQAEIRTDGAVRFRTAIGQPVTPRANQPAVELMLEPATDEPEPILGRTLALSKFGAGSLQIEGRGTAVVFRGSVNIRATGDADVTLSSTVFSGKLTFIDDTTARITVTNSGDANASGEIIVNYSGRNLRSITSTNLVVDGQNVTLRF